jgi:MraZ protein
VKKSEKSQILPEELLFLGEYEHSLDSQGRLAIPKTWRRKEEENRFILVPGRNKTLQLIPYESFKENFLEKAKKVSLANAEGALALARFASKAQECKCDKQGRIQLGPGLLKYASLKSGVKLIGSIWYAQLWDIDRWIESQADEDEFFDELEKISEMPDDLTNVLKGALGKLKE